MEGQLAEAWSMAVEDPEILSGTPVIRGTRIPVHDVAAQVESGATMNEILEMYPSLSSAQVKLASIYARAVPRPERGRRLSIPPGAKIIFAMKK